jgi:hypothetical protein
MTLPEVREDPGFDEEGPIKLQSDVKTKICGGVETDIDKMER